MNNLRFRKPSYSIACLLAGFLLLLAGCSKSEPVGKVEGKVLFDGKPYTEAAVVFLNAETGQGGAANIQADGSFTLAEPIPVGTYVVYLAPKIADDNPTGSGEEGTEGPVSMVSDESVPAKYWNEADSDIRIQIQEGPNNVTVELKKE